MAGAIAGAEVWQVQKSRKDGTWDGLSLPFENS